MTAPYDKQAGSGRELGSYSVPCGPSGVREQIKVFVELWPFPRLQFYIWRRG